MTPAPRLLLAALLVPLLAACGGGGGDTADAPTPAAAGPTSADAPSPSPSPSVDVRSVELDAQGVGVDVGAWSVAHDFTFPADQDEFEKVKLRNPLPQGSKVAYRRVGAKKFQVCVTAYVGSDPAAWAVYDSVEGTGKGAAGAPTASFCP